jgi:uncharacterized protein (DUF433 family)
MTDKELLERIRINPKVRMGKPIIRDTRLTVEFILNLLAHGATVQQIMADYKDLTAEDVQACILFASKSLENTAVMPVDVQKLRGKYKGKGLLKALMAEKKREREL